MKQCRCGIHPLFQKVHWTALSSSCPKGKSKCVKCGRKAFFKSLGLGDSPGDQVKTPCFNTGGPGQGTRDPKATIEKDKRKLS